MHVSRHARHAVVLGKESVLARTDAPVRARKLGLRADASIHASRTYRDKYPRDSWLRRGLPARLKLKLRLQGALMSMCRGMRELGCVLRRLLLEAKEDQQSARTWPPGIANYSKPCAIREGCVAAAEYITRLQPEKNWRWIREFPPQEEIVVDASEFGYGTAHGVVWPDDGSTAHTSRATGKTCTFTTTSWS